MKKRNNCKRDPKEREERHRRIKREIKCTQGDEMLRKQNAEEEIRRSGSDTKTCEAAMQQQYL